MSVKVLVRAKWREVRAVSGVRYSKNPLGQIIENNMYRQFVDHQCFMTPEEANFLVSNPVNDQMKNTTEGPNYWYPAGIPAPIPGEADPALTDDSFISSDHRMVEAAKRREDAIREQLGPDALTGVANAPGTGHSDLKLKGTKKSGPPAIKDAPPSE